MFGFPKKIKLLTVKDELSKKVKQKPLCSIHAERFFFVCFFPFSKQGLFVIKGERNEGHYHVCPLSKARCYC